VLLHDSIGSWFELWLVLWARTLLSHHCCLVACTNLKFWISNIKTSNALNLQLSTEVTVARNLRRRSCYMYQTWWDPRSKKKSRVTPGLVMKISMDVLKSLEAKVPSWLHL
jgi:hypothetical protein